MTFKGGCLVLVGSYEYGFSRIRYLHTFLLSICRGVYFRAYADDEVSLALPTSNSLDLNG